jgi:uncharacterized membrane protein
LIELSFCYSFLSLSDYIIEYTLKFFGQILLCVIFYLSLVFTNHLHVYIIFSHRFRHVTLIIDMMIMMMMIIIIIIIIIIIMNSSAIDVLVLDSTGTFIKAAQNIQN